MGAFNVYNLEGVMAVVAAAEAEKSPAILQVTDAPSQIAFFYFFLGNNCNVGSMLYLRVTTTVAIVVAQRFPTF